MEKDKEKAILQAAEEEFIQKGFGGAKTTSIAAKAGVTHAMLHYYYRTKDNLFSKVFESKFTILGTNFVTAFSNHSLCLLKRIEVGIRLHFDFLRDNPDLPRFIINELISRPERHDLIKDRLQLMLGSIRYSVEQDLKSAIAKGEIYPISLTNLLIDIISLNAFVFVALPVLEPIAMQEFEDMDTFLLSRKEENVCILMNRLTPKTK